MQPSLMSLTLLVTEQAMVLIVQMELTSLVKKLVKAQQMQSMLTSLV